MNAARKSGIGILIGAKDANGNLRRVFVNEAAADMFGYSVDELLAQPAFFNVAPTSLARRREATERRSEGQPIVELLDMPCIPKDGSTAHLQAAFSPTWIAGGPASV